MLVWGFGSSTSKKGAKTSSYLHEVSTHLVRTNHVFYNACKTTLHKTLAMIAQCHLKNEEIRKMESWYSNQQLVKTGPDIFAQGVQHELNGRRHSTLWLGTIEKLCPQLQAARMGYNWANLASTVPCCLPFSVSIVRACLISSTQLLLRYCTAHLRSTHAGPARPFAPRSHAAA